MSVSTILHGIVVGILERILLGSQTGSSQDPRGSHQDPRQDLVGILDRILLESYKILLGSQTAGRLIVRILQDSEQYQKLPHTSSTINWLKNGLIIKRKQKIFIIDQIYLNVCCVFSISIYVSQNLSENMSQSLAGLTLHIKLRYFTFCFYFVQYFFIIYSVECRFAFCGATVLK